ncbi:serine protease Do [Lutibacter agarilyticus]|uniref:Serine protease Do n=1 Tax=Lutibacter agarilyticus TaxID=1109740 RepID=A0A238XA61_9FLAO|nr:trypsin-like peptidase domain-containing protein [Lutibacter agarilyticus]SNR55925.1 serine protease Do [Lutibacter agarilyticus]
MKKYISIALVFFVSFTAISQNLASIYKKVNSSTVVIKTINNVSAGSGDKQKVNTAGGQGSGVLISNDGLIWTASHVVHSADKVAVKFNDGDVYEAEVLSSNPLADVALIKVVSDFKLKQKHVAAIGNSNAVMVGEDIFVIGAPLGVEQTLTKGIVSGRISPEEIGNDFAEVEYLQTDAAINQGNSGGPMFNMKGQVIGIASFILSQSGSSAGLGFGTTSNVAKKVLMEQPNLWTGMEFLILSDELADVFNLPQEAGLLVLSVTSTGLGNKMGLRGGYINAVIEGKEILIGGDIILEVAGIRLNTPEGIMKLQKRMISFQKGETYLVKYLRAGEVRMKAMLHQ